MRIAHSSPARQYFVRELGLSDGYTQSLRRSCQPPIEGDKRSANALSNRNINRVRRSQRQIQPPQKTRGESYIDRQHLDRVRGAGDPTVKGRKRGPRLLNREIPGAAMSRNRGSEFGRRKIADDEESGALGA